MTERPTFLFVGDAARGFMDARTLHGYDESPGTPGVPVPNYDASRFPGARRDEDFLLRQKNPKFDWWERHKAAGFNSADPGEFVTFADIRPFIFNQSGIERAISGISYNGDKTSRIVATGSDGGADEPDDDADQTIVIQGVVVNSGPDPNGFYWARRASANNYDVDGQFGGSYDFQSTAVTASGGRTLRIDRPDSLNNTQHWDTRTNKHRIVAGSGDFVADGFRPGQRLSISGNNAGAYNRLMLSTNLVEWPYDGIPGGHVDPRTGGAGYPAEMLIETVTATEITFRNQGSNGWWETVGAQSSDVTIQGTAVIHIQSADSYLNPLFFFFGRPNGITELWPATVGMYPSNEHGLEAGFIAEHLDDTQNPREFSVNPYVVQSRGDVTGSRLFASEGDADMFEIVSPSDGTLGYVSTGPTGTVLRLDVSASSGTHGWSGTEWVHVELGPGYEALNGYWQATIISNSDIRIPVDMTGVSVPSIAQDPFLGRTVGSVAARQFVLTAVSATSDGTEITTSADHGLAVGDWVCIGNLTSVVSINGAHQVLEIVDSDTFRIGVVVDTPSSIDQAWMCKGRRWSRAYSTKQGNVDPHNGGSALEYTEYMLRSAWTRAQSAGDTTHLAGIFAEFGWFEDVVAAPGDPEFDVAKQGTQINRFWIHYAVLLKQLREFGAQLAEDFGFPITHNDPNGDPADGPDQIPVVVLNYSPHQVIGANNLTSDVTGKWIANAWLIRQQTPSRVLPAIGGKVGMVDPATSGRDRKADGWTYTADSALRIGQDIQRVWRQTEKGRSLIPGNEQISVPVYFLIGQSQTQGWTESLVLHYDRDPLYNGNWVDTNGAVIPGRERHCYIWHHGTKQFEEQHGCVPGGAPGNSNTHPVQNAIGAGLYGPEVSLILNLRERHPNGVYLIKLARHAASIQNNQFVPSWSPDAGDLYQDLLHAWWDAVAWLAERGLVADARGFVYDQGEGDTYDGYYQTYAQNLDYLFQKIREDFQTRRDEPLPIVIGRLMDHPRNPFEPAGVVAVRAAQEAKAASDPNIGIADLDSVPIIDDAVHRSSVGAIRAGLLLGDAFDQCASHNHPRVLDYELEPFTSGGIPASFDPDVQVTIANNGDPGGFESVV